MKALVLNRYGSIDNLSLEEVAKPIVKNNEVLVRVQAVSINDWDLGIIEGNPFINRLLMGLFKPKFKILGSDISGIVEAVGEDVSQFKVGDYVYGDLSGARFGGFAEYVSVQEKHLCKMAKDMPFDIAAAIPQAGMLAYQALHDFTEVKDGMEILVNGAGGGVGTYVIQMLKDKAVQVTGVDDAVKEQTVLDLGYKSFIDYRTVDFTKLEQKYDMIIDCKTNRSLKHYARVLKESGIYITLGGDLPKVIKIMLFSKRLEAKYHRKYKGVQLRANKNLSDINDFYEKGYLTSIIDSNSFNLDQGKEALTYYASGKQKGKVVIKII